MIAIDANPDNVAAARSLGVDARTASWPDFEAPRVDAVAFTRSLHHIAPLAAALAQARAVLGERGVLLIDDFAYEAMDAPTAAWMRSMAERFQSAPWLREGGDPLAVWQAHHRRHGVHEFRRVERAVRAQGFFGGNQPVPYLYRYFTGDAAERAFAEETQAIAAGTIAQMGRRIAASQRT